MGPNIDIEAAAKPWTASSHHLRIAEHDSRLIPSRRQRVDLGTPLTIRSEHVETNS